MLTFGERRVVLERLQQLPEALKQQMMRREEELVRQGADDEQLDALHRLYLRQLELRGL